MPATMTAARTAMEATPMESTKASSATSEPPIPSTKPTTPPSPTPASTVTHRPTRIVRPSIVIIRVSVIISRIIRTNPRDVRSGRCGHHNLYRWLGRPRTVGRRHRPRHWLLPLIILLTGLLLLLHLPVALDHGLGDFLWHSQSLQIDE